MSLKNKRKKKAGRLHQCLKILLRVIRIEEITYFINCIGRKDAIYKKEKGN